MTQTRQSPSQSGSNVTRRCVAAFFLTSVGVYGWGLWGRERLAETPQATAVVRQAQAVSSDRSAPPAEQLREIERSVASRSSLEAALRSVEGKHAAAQTGSFEQRVDAVREQVSVRAAAGASPEAAEISITCHNNDAALAVSLANALATRYAALANEPWQQQMNAALTTAADATREARRKLEQAEGQLETYLAQVAAEAAKPAPPPVETDDFDRLPLGRQLERLTLRRASLLTALEPAHPEVQELDERIAALELALAENDVPEAWQPLPLPEPQPAPRQNPLADATERVALERTIAVAQQELDRAVQHETACRTALLSPPQITTELAETLPAQSSAATDIPWTLFGMALAAGVIVSALVGLFSGRPRVSPTIDTVEGLERRLKVPVIAVLPARDAA